MATTKIRSGIDTSKGSADPTAGTWDVGDVVWNSAATPGSAAGRICTTAGTLGTLVATVTTTAGSTSITVNSGMGSLETGQFITIAGVSGIKRIVGNVDGSLSYAISIDSPADASVGAAAAAWSPAVFSLFGIVVAGK